MSRDAPAGAASPDLPGWTDRDGQPIGCVEKRRVLEENETELAGVLRDAYEDAVLMGVDEAVIRTRLHGLVDRLRTPLA